MLQQLTGTVQSQGQSLEQLTSLLRGASLLSLEEREIGKSTDIGLDTAQFEASEAVVVTPSRRRDPHQQRDRTVVRLSLRPWFQSRVYNFAILRSLSGWKGYLHIYNTVPVNAPIFKACRRGTYTLCVS
jgi:hypothetical protein